MSTLTDSLVGKRFTRLVVIEFTYKKNGNNYYKCKCLCGTEKNIRSSDLLRGNTKSCGCLSKLNQELMNKDIFEYNGSVIKPGDKFGKLTVIKFSHIKSRVTENIENNTKQIHYVVHLECKCSCGNISYPSIYSLLVDKTLSCGCSNRLKNGKFFNSFNNYLKKKNIFFKEEEINGK